MIRRLVPLVAAAMLAMSPQAAAGAKKLPANWDGLVKVESKRVAAVYLLPGADFRGYSKIVIDPPQIAFHKDWRSEYNHSQRGLGGRVSESDIRKAIDAGTSFFVEALAKAYAKAGYQVVDAPGEDVLRVSTAIVDISVDAPDQLSAARTRSHSREAGEATLVVEVRDSLSGTLMGRALDRQAAGDRAAGPFIRNRATNRADFEDLFSQWAKTSADGIGRLKAMSPVNGPSQP